MSLGDLDLDDDGTTLYVLNLHDRRIHRYAVPDGQALGAIDIGSAGQPWAENARPFGLAFKGGMLYHGVVDSREKGELPGTLRGDVYRSRPDGSDMEEVSSFDLTYGTPPEVWTPWVSEPLAERWPTPPFPRPDGGQPLLADIELDRSGALALGLRNRVADMYWPLEWGGDLIPARPIGTAFEVRPVPEHYQDNTSRNAEPLRGGLAVEPGAWSVLGTRVDRQPSYTAFLWEAVWFDHQSGRVAGPWDGHEPLLDNETKGPGDIELLCPAVFVPTPFPSRTASATPSPPPSVTATATATPTNPPSPTPTATPAPVYLPVAAERTAAPSGWTWC